MLSSLQVTALKVPSPELENSTFPGSFDPSADFAIAVQVVGDPSFTVDGLHVTFVLVGTSCVDVVVVVEVIVVVVGEVVVVVLTEVVVDVTVVVVGDVVVLVKVVVLMLVTVVVTVVVVGEV